MLTWDNNIKWFPSKQHVFSDNNFPANFLWIHNAPINTRWHSGCCNDYVLDPLHEWISEDYNISLNIALLTDISSLKLYLLMLCKLRTQTESYVHMLKWKEENVSSSDMKVLAKSPTVFSKTQNISLILLQRTINSFVQVFSVSTLRTYKYIQILNPFAMVPVHTSIWILNLLQ